MHTNSSWISLRKCKGESLGTEKHYNNDGKVMSGNESEGNYNSM